MLRRTYGASYSPGVNDEEFVRRYLREQQQSLEAIASASRQTPPSLDPNVHSNDGDDGAFLSSSAAQPPSSSVPVDVVQWWVSIATQDVAWFPSSTTEATDFRDVPLERFGLAVPLVFLAVLQMREWYGGSTHRRVEDVLVDMMGHEMVDLLKTDVEPTDVSLEDTIRWYDVFHFLVYVVATFPEWSARAPMPDVFTAERELLPSASTTAATAMGTVRKDDGDAVSRRRPYVSLSTLTRWSALENDMQTVWMAAWSKKNSEAGDMLASADKFYRTIWENRMPPADPQRYLPTLATALRDRRSALRQQVTEERQETHRDDGDAALRGAVTRDVPPSGVPPSEAAPPALMTGGATDVAAATTASAAETVAIATGAVAVGALLWASWSFGTTVHTRWRGGRRSSP